MVGVGGDVVLVRDHDDRLALLVKFGEEVHDFDAHRRVEIAGRLVREDDDGVRRERAGDGDALLLSARELVRPVVEALAEAMGVDPATFAKTMEDWNAAVAAQKDEAFGRTSFAKALDTAPFYAIKVAPGIHHTMGGVVINTNAEVLDANGAPIAGLFAAGEVTGGVHGANRLGGNAVADIVVFGRIAAKSAAAFIK